MDCAEKVASGLVVAGGDGAILLEPGKEILNQVTRPIQMPVMVAPLLAVALGGNDDAFAGVFQGRDHPLLGVIGFIGDNSVRRDVRQQRIGPFQVMRLSRRQMKTGRVAQGVNGGVELGAQPAAAAPDRLDFAPPFFAPALC